MDVEDEIDLFFIRKDELDEFSEASSRNKYSKANCFPDVVNCVPLMLKHVESLNETGQNVNNLVFNSVKFKNCLVYGKIIGKGIEYKSSYSYILDDGTSTIFINLFRRTDDMELICNVNNELEAVKRQMLAQNNNEMLNSLKNLLFRTKEQIDNSNIPMGSNVLVYGKPTFFRGQTFLKVFHIIEDGKCNRDIEIHFKDYLIEWYKNNFLLTNS